MSSPFAAYANAVIRFEVVDSGPLVADRNGNLRPSSAVVEVSAMLSQKADQNRQPGPGVDPASIRLEGYLVEPRPLPSVVTPDSPASIVWQGREGRFYIDFTARNPYLAALDIDLVERIRGWFLPGSYSVEGEEWEPGLEPGPEADGLRMPFSWGDASPKLIAEIPEGRTIFTAQIVIQVPFNGTNPQLRLGDALVSDRLIKATENMPAEAAEYETNPGYTYLAATDVLLTITPGEGCSQGSGFVLLEI